MKHFRAIEPDDFSSVVDLLDEAFPDLERDFIESDLRGVQESDGKLGVTYGLWEDGLVATVTYGPYYGEDWDGEGIIRYLAVRSDYLGRGYGTNLAKICVEAMRIAKCRCVVVGIDPKNEAAVKLWKKLGFEYYDASDNDLYHSYVLWFPE